MRNCKEKMKIVVDFKQNIVETLGEFELKGLLKEGTLEDSLDAYTKPKLVSLAELNDFEVKKSWNKGQMVSVISEGLRESLEERLSAFKGEKLAALQDVLAGEFEDLTSEQAELYGEVVSSAVRKGLLFVSSNDDELVFSMPAEFEDKLTDAEKNDEVVEEEIPKVVTESVKKTPFTTRPQRRQPVQQRIVGKKVGRNDPCPCGSGKKYKKCCWSKDQRN